MGSNKSRRLLEKREMERNREARRVTGNGFSKRRHRAGSFKDSPEEEIPVEFQEAARLRDRAKNRDREREKEKEKERDRLNSNRSKRRRGGNMDDEDDDTSDESVNDDEEYDDGDGGGRPPILPPASLISHHQRKSFPSMKVFRSSPSSPPWKATDEMIGVSVPRKARSASTKRSHESWISPASPSNVRKKMIPGPKQLPPKSPVAVQDEIEMEIAEVLYGMMTQPQGLSKQESTGEIEIGKLAANSSSSIVPKSKRPRLVKYEEENINTIKGEEEVGKPSLDLRFMAAEQPEKKEEKLSPEMESFRSDGGGGDVTISLRVKASMHTSEKEKIDINLMTQSSPVRDSDIEYLTTTEAKPKVTIVESETKPLLDINEDEKCKDDLIVGLEEDRNPRTEKSVRNCQLKLDLEISNHFQKQTISSSEKAAQANPMPLHMSIPGWAGGIPTMGYLGPTQGVMPADASSLPSTTMQPPHLFFNQPRPKRCATHCYIARNIHYHQQFTKMNPFWAAAAGSAPLYGSKACNLSLMPSAELQGSVVSRGSNSQSTPNSLDTAQGKQILLQQALPPGAGNTILHGPTFIFPLGQQPHPVAAIAAASVRPLNTGNTVVSSGAAAASASMNGSASATPAGALFSYPNMPNSETQYLAILQNNGYSLAHAGAPPAYRGVAGQPMPFFNGSFYSSQMVQTPHLQPQQQSGQVQQSHAPSNQNTNVSTGSSAAQKHLQNQQQRPLVNSQGFPTQKVQSQPSSFQHRQQPRENATQHSDSGGKARPSTADSRGSRSNVVYGQNFAMPIQPTNMGLIGSATSSGGVASTSNNHGEKKPDQQGSKAGAEAMQSQPYAMTFATFSGGPNMPPSIAQNQAIFHGVPETSRQGYHQMMAAAVVAQTAKQKMNYSSPEDGKSGSVAAANATEERKTTGANGKTTTACVGQSTAFSSKQNSADVSASAVTSGSIIDSSARLLKLGSAQPWSSNSAPTSHQQQHMQRNQPQQQYSNYLQMQQQYAVAAARGKGPVTSNGSVFPDHNIATTPSVGASVPNASSVFPQNSVQSGGGSPAQWKNNSPRANTMAQAQSPSMLSPSASSSLKNVQQKQQGRPQQAQIYFAPTSKTLRPNSPMQQGPGVANRSPSPSTSSVSKSAGGSPRTTPSNSMANKAGHGQTSPSTLSSQPSKNSQSASSAGGRNNGQSVLGNPHVTTTTANSTFKSQQQQQHMQQAQVFFSNPYMQPQHYQQQQMTISPASGYYIQRHQQQQQAGSSAAATSVTLSSCTTTTTTSDQAKAVNMKGGGNNNNLQHTQTAGKTHQQQLVPPGFPYVTAGKTHQQQLVPPGFPYVHAVQAKPGDQKQQAAFTGVRNRRLWTVCEVITSLCIGSDRHIRVKCWSELKMKADGSVKKQNTSTLTDQWEERPLRGWSWCLENCLQLS
ncbi:hypothetical protein AALP_AAs71926U000100 [Arabis alpina]|uniref:G protein gamma domain-containing protein n=1 Tax=Arabis alpina TaxID=50452 RepID=A0A087FWI8_ARAAL|nr:hypothetical protein AALP_AAs71926U000100 [Arabis alpina]